MLDLDLSRSLSEVRNYGLLENEIHREAATSRPAEHGTCQVFNGQNDAENLETYGPNTGILTAFLSIQSAD